MKSMRRLLLYVNLLLISAFLGYSQYCSSALTSRHLPDLRSGKGCSGHVAKYTVSTIRCHHIAAIVHKKPDQKKPVNKERIARANISSCALVSMTPHYI